MPPKACFSWNLSFFSLASWGQRLVRILALTSSSEWWNINPWRHVVLLIFYFDLNNILMAKPREGCEVKRNVIFVWLTSLLPMPEQSPVEAHAYIRNSISQKQTLDWSKPISPALLFICFLLHYIYIKYKTLKTVYLQSRLQRKEKHVFQQTREIL